MVSFGENECVQCACVCYQFDVEHFTCKTNNNKIVFKFQNVIQFLVIQFLTGIELVSGIKAINAFF